DNPASRGNSVIAIVLLIDSIEHNGSPINWSAFEGDGSRHDAARRAAAAAQQTEGQGKPQAPTHFLDSRYGHGCGLRLKSERARAVLESVSCRIRPGRANEPDGGETPFARCGRLPVSAEADAAVAVARIAGPRPGRGTDAPRYGTNTAVTQGNVHAARVRVL